MYRSIRFPGVRPTLMGGLATVLAVACGGQGGSELDNAPAAELGESRRPVVTAQDLPASADTWVVAASPTLNNGSDTELRTKQLDATSGRRAFLKFNLGGLSGSVVSAKLRLFNTYAQAGTTLALTGVADDGWTETGLTWNNQPALGSTLGTAVPALGTWLEVDVTSFVAQQAAGDKVASFGLVEQTTGHDTNFASREYATAGSQPVLQVTTSTTGGGSPSYADASQYLNDPYPAGLTPVPATPGNLQSVLNAAVPGQLIELSTTQGSYTGDYTLSKTATLLKPIVVRSKAGGRAKFTGRFTLSGTAGSLDGVDVTGTNGQVLVQGSRNRVTRTKFYNKPFNTTQYTDGTGWAMEAEAGDHHHFDHNEFFNLALWGLRLNGSPGPRSTWVERNYWHDWTTPLNSDGTNKNAVECLQVGGGANSTPESYEAIVEWNLLENATTGDDETISVKSSNNTLAYNTIRNANRFQNRGGAGNKWIANWSIGSSGLYLNCKGTVAIGNHVVNSQQGLLVQAGTYDWDNPPADHKGMCRAENILLAGNQADRAEIGDDTFSGANLDAIGTRVEAHRDAQGNLVTGWKAGVLIQGPLEASTTIVSTTTQVVPDSHALTPSEVGPN